MTEHADATQETECLVHEERVEHWYRQFDVTEMSGTLVRRQVAGGASGNTRRQGEETISHRSFGLSLTAKRSYTDTSARSAGPRAGSYNPPVVGMFKLSSKIGFVICLTEIFLISRLDKKEKEMALAWVGSECAISILESLESVYRRQRLVGPGLFLPRSYSRCR
jgi:hypothetical protein